MERYVSWTWECLLAHEAAPPFGYRLQHLPPTPPHPTCRPSGGDVYFSTFFEGPNEPEEERGVGLDKQLVDYTKPESCKGLVDGEMVVI